jgi:hypothetical protein
MEAGFAALALLIAVVVFGMTVAALELGRRLGIRHAAAQKPGVPTGAGVVTSAVSWLLTLLLGFTFAGATSRFEHRRDLVEQQAEKVRSAWERIDALPPERQTAVRADFQRYFDAVITSYADRKHPGSQAAEEQRRATADAQRALWSRSVAACLEPDGEKARMLLLPSLTEMFVAIEREQFARRQNPPAIIWLMLAIAIGAAALLAGYNTANVPGRPWVAALTLAAVVSSVTYVIIELEYPRLGIVRIDTFDRALHELRATMRT